MPTISKLNAELTTSVTGFSAGMRQAGQDVGGFGESFRSAAGLVAGAAATLGLGFTIEGATEFLKSTFETIDASAHLATSLGVSTEALGHLQYSAKLAGVAAEELDGGLTKMLKNIDAARDGNKGAAEAFEKLGISVKDLKGLSPDQAFARIGQAISQMNDPAARAHATMELFGKTGASLLPILTEGADKLNAEAAEADHFGVALNDIDSAKVENAHESIARVEEAIQGAANKLIVAMAPYIDVVANKLLDLSQTGNGMANTLVNGFESVVKGVAYAADYLHLFEAGWDTLKGVVIGAALGVVDEIDLVGRSLVSLINLLPGVHVQWTDTFSAMADDLKTQMFDAFGAAGNEVDKFSSGESSAKVAGFFDGIKTHADAAAKATDDAHKKFGGLAGDSDLETKDKEAEKAAKQLEEQAKKLWEETRTPAEKYAETVDRITKLHKEGFVDNDTFTRGLAKAQEDLDKTLNKLDKVKHIEIDAPHALEAGSSDAAEFVAKFQAQQRENQREAEIAANTRAANNHLADIAKAVTSPTHNISVVSWGHVT